MTREPLDCCRRWRRSSAVSAPKLDRACLPRQRASSDPIEPHGRDAREAGGAKTIAYVTGRLGHSECGKICGKKQSKSAFLYEFSYGYADNLAERVGFEPTVRLHVQRFSRPSQSATLSPLQWRRRRVIGTVGNRRNACSSSHGENQHAPHRRGATHDRSGLHDEAQIGRTGLPRMALAALAQW